MKNLTRKEFIKTCCFLSASCLGLPMRLKGKGSHPRNTSGLSEEDPEKGKMIAFCGISCAECPTYIATQKDDDQMRADTAKKWSEMFKASYQPEDINCDGCTSNSERLFSYCSACEIRKCGKQKNVKNCAYCEEYPCAKLTEFLKMVPEAKTTLEEIRKKINR
ncbi:MAG: DUF3795 domain-containing protein [Candidatus Aminicenantales bacterium]